MMNAAHDLPMIWMGLVILVMTIYVLLDGFDLGVGILFSVQENEVYRDLMIATISPIWDGNETWMVLAGATLLGVFPIAYGVLLPALYIPIIIMLLALIFRGVAFEFRAMERTALRRHLWDRLFMIASMVASFCQGSILGSVLCGVHIDHHHFSGGAMDWLHPFSVFTGLCVMVGYALVGASWLFWRTEGELQQQAAYQVKKLACLLFISTAIALTWASFAQLPFMHRWSNASNLLFTLAFFALLVVSGWGMFKAIDSKCDVMPFIYTLFWFLLCLIGLAVHLWPYIVPPSLTIWDVASPVSSQEFELVGTVCLLPLLIGYMVFSYYHFRGKVTQNDGYYEE